MKKNIIITLMMLSILAFYSNGQTITPKAEIIPYIEFIKEPHPSAKDYILSLFDKYDIVILSERHHGEMAQYDLINDVISDRRFIDNVGNVFTEVGVVNMTDKANEFLHGSYPPADADSILMDLHMNADYYMLWEKYNFYTYLKQIYQLNQTLPSDKKINAYFTDCPFSWDTVTVASQYNFFENNVLPERDSIMAINMINGFENVQKGNRKKALVIFNNPHSYMLELFYFGKSVNGEYAGDIKDRNAGWYIREKYGDRVTNVLLNTVIFDDNVENMAMANGKWDAAFYTQGFPNMGFELKGSPFGRDTFDMRQGLSSVLNYEDVFDSYVYYKSPMDQLHIWGVPEVVNSKSIDELLRREYIARPESKAAYSREELIDHLNSYYGRFHIMHVISEDEKMKYDKNINQWFEVKEK